MVETLKNSNALSASISARIRSISSGRMSGPGSNFYPQIRSKNIGPRFRPSGWICAARSRTFYRSPQRSPEKPNPSRRLDRDGK